MDERRERIADAAEAWARALQRHEDARCAFLSKAVPRMDDAAALRRAAEASEYARAELLRACGKVGA
jgi:hypothetical protein